MEPPNLFPEEKLFLAKEVFVSAGLTQTPGAWPTMTWFILNDGSWDAAPFVSNCP